MSDEENQSVVAEEAQEVVAQPTETEGKQEESQASAEVKKARDDQAYNWAETRRKMQELERQNQELKERFDKGESKKTPEIDELDQIGDSDIITKAQAKKLAEKMAKEIASQVVKERDAQTLPDRIKAKFTDFDDVVTTENIELLKKIEPELAMSLASNPDPYAQAVSVYKTMKSMGMGKEVVKNSMEKDKALKNSQKPISVNSVTKQSPIGDAHKFENGLTPDLKKQMWEEMKSAMKRA